MSKKAHKHDENKQPNKRVNINEERSNEDELEGSARRRLKKLSEVNIK